jgi:hypothetical protein
MVFVILKIKTFLERENYYEKVVLFNYYVFCYCL